MVRQIPRIAVTLLVPALLLTGCKKHDDEATTDTTAAGGRAVQTDTTITSAQVKDTTVVKHDTTVRIDTVKQTHHGADTAHRIDSIRHRKP